MRIVSLCPSLTELVFDLGRGADLVGITTFCIHPKEGALAIEKVGGTKTPKVERIVELAPDIVLLNNEENRKEDAEQLVGAGLQCHTSMPRNAAETATTVRSIGAALERRAAAEVIAADIEARAERIRQAALGQPPVSWAYLIWRKPWMTVNADTFVDGLMGLAGGVNVFADLGERYPTIEVADLAAADPDLVMLCTEPFLFTGSHLEELVKLTGMSSARFLIADGELLSWHGSRTPLGLDYAESLVIQARLRRASQGKGPL